MEIKPEDLTITETDEYYEVHINDESELYQRLVILGKLENPDLEDKEAAKLAVENIIEEYGNATESV